MHDNTLIAIIMATVGSGAVFGVFTFPPLTSAGGSSFSGSDQAGFEQAINAELSFCSGLDERINCACFAQTSATIQSYDHEQIPGLLYMEQLGLARIQAAQSC